MIILLEHDREALWLDSARAKKQNRVGGPAPRAFQSWRDSIPSIGKSIQMEAPHLKIELVVIAFVRQLTAGNSIHHIFPDAGAGHRLVLATADSTELGCRMLFHTDVETAAPPMGQPIYLLQRMMQRSLVVTPRVRRSSLCQTLASLFLLMHPRIFLFQQ